MASRVLVVEDDAKTAASIDMYLRHAGFDTEVARDGTDGLARARSVRPDLVILDVMLPGIDGLAICEALRADGIAVILVTARSTEADKLRGLDLGADDYVTKPFSPRELVARVKTVLRRTEPAVVRTGDVEIDPVKHEVRVRGDAVVLTAAELRIVETLARTPGRVYRRDELSEGSDRVVDAHVKNLRKKLGADRITTVIGLGYKLG